MRGYIGAAIAGIVLVAGTAGVILYAHSTETPEEGLAKAIANLNTAVNAASDGAPSIFVIEQRSACTVNRRTGTITFQIALHNRETFTFETTVRPLVIFDDGGALATSTYDKLVSITGSAGRTVLVVLPYNAKRHKPIGCRVHVTDADTSDITLRRSTLMA